MKKSIAVFKTEIYKVWIKNRFILIFLSLLVIDSTLFIKSMQTSTFENVSAQNLYEQEIAILSGKSNTEKYEYVEHKNIVTKTIMTQVEDNYDTPSKQKEIVFDHPLIFEEEKVYSYLMMQMNYVEKNIDQRYIMNATSWNIILGTQGIQFGLILFTLSIAVNTFKNEEQAGIKELNRTTTFGRNKILIYQNILVLGSGVFYLIISKIIEILILFPSLKNTINFPIQSLTFYGNSPWNISLIQMLIVITIIQSLGVIYLTFLIRCISYLVKSTAFIYVVTLLIVLLPSFLINNYDIYRFPFPNALLMAVGYVRGPEAIITYFDIPNYGFTNLMYVASIILVLYIAMKLIEKQGGYNE